MAAPITQQKMMQDFGQIQKLLMMLERDIEQGSVYARQSAAFRDLQRWIRKAEKISISLGEMRL